MSYRQVTDKSVPFTDRQAVVGVLSVPVGDTKTDTFLRLFPKESSCSDVCVGMSVRTYRTTKKSRGTREATDNTDTPTNAAGPPVSRRPGRGHQTAVALAPAGLDVAETTPELRAELVRLLVEALVADFMSDSDAIGCVPLGPQP